MRYVRFTQNSSHIECCISLVPLEYVCTRLDACVRWTTSKVSLIPREGLGTRLFQGKQPLGPCHGCVVVQIWYAPIYAATSHLTTYLTHKTTAAGSLSSASACFISTAAFWAGACWLMGACWLVGGYWFMGCYYLKVLLPTLYMLSVPGCHLRILWHPQIYMQAVGDTYYTGNLPKVPPPPSSFGWRQRRPGNKAGCNLLQHTVQISKIGSSSFYYFFCLFFCFVLFLEMRAVGACVSQCAC